MGVERDRTSLSSFACCGNVWQNASRARSSWVSLEGTINSPVGAHIQYPAALMTNYSNQRVMSMAQYGFNCNTASADCLREQI